MHKTNLKYISIHALCEEGDRQTAGLLDRGFLFLSTPSARRATPHYEAKTMQWFNFYPRPLRGGRPCSCRRRVPPAGISIHALCEEGDVHVLMATHNKAISIHALCEEGDSSPAWTEVTTMRFLSTPSARRATHKGSQSGDWKTISIHALCEEGDRGWTTIGGHQRHFYPRPLRGGRQHVLPKSRRRYAFLSTPSARRATAKTETKSLFSNKLYNILHEFRRALIYNGSKSYPNHAK